MEKKKSGLATAGMVLGIIAICTSFLPIINNASFIMGAIAATFGLVALLKKVNNGKTISAIVLGILAIIITLSLQSSWSDSLDDLSDELDNMTGANTQEVLKKVNVSIEKFTVTEDKYGLTDTKLPVTITNLTNERKSFDFEIEAVDDNGNRIDTDTIYIGNLAAGQSQTINAFEYVSSDDLNAMKTAKFNIIEASMY